LLRDALAGSGGEEVKGTGDGLHATFPSVSAALACATATQQAVDRHNRDGLEQLGVRIGVSHGEAELADDQDYYGASVVEAARLCAAAVGGQIVTTELVKALTGSRGGHEFAAAGLLELKGLPESVAAVEVRWEPLGNELRVPLPPRCTQRPGAGFVGRRRERELMVGALKLTVAESVSRVILIGGEPGIGKTALACAFAQLSHDEGAVVLYGRCDEDLGAPYQPWVEVLAHLVTHATPSLVDGLAPHVASLARLAPALAARFGAAASETSSVDAETARYLLFADVRSVLRVTGELAPVVVILDDLQWADIPSLQLLRHLAGAVDPIRLLIVGTFRESDIDASHALSDVLAAMHREAGAERIRLRGLDDLELLTFMEGAAGQAMDDAGIVLRDALLRETDGNPFFVGELLRHLIETNAIYQRDGRWLASSDLQEHGLPLSVREVIGRRVARLGEDATRALAVASVIGRDFDLAVLAGATGLDENALLDVMDRAVAATLVVNVAGDHYSFAHALVEHALYETLSSARRARLHRAVAEAIEGLTGGEAGERVAELASHWAQATRPDDLDKAIGYAQAAGDWSLAKLAPDEALRWYGEALLLLEGRPAHDDRQRCALLVGLGDAQRQVGMPDFRGTLLDAARLASTLEITDLLVAAALANTRGFFSAAGVVDAERVAVLEEAIAVAPHDSGERALLLARLASELTYGGDASRRLAIANEALDTARRLGDPATVVAVINDIFQAINLPESLETNHARLGEALELATELGDPMLEYWAAAWRNVTAVRLGDHDEGDRCLERMLAIGRDLRQPLLLWYCEFVRSSMAVLAGDLEEAERLAEAALEIGTQAGQPDAFAIYAAELNSIRDMQGRSGELVDVLAQVTVENPGIPGLRGNLAWAYCSLGHYDQALNLIGPDIDDGFPAIPRDPLWLGAMCRNGQIIAELGLVDTAPQILIALTPFADHMIYFGALVGHVVRYTLGLLAATVGERDEALAHLAGAAKRYERLGARYFLAQTRLEWGRILSSGPSEEDRTQAARLLDQALEAARGGGYAFIEQRAASALEQLAS
jgi:tetratricopeptide (TPR) repeat protein